MLSSGMLDKFAKSHDVTTLAEHTETWVASLRLPAGCGDVVTLKDDLMRPAIRCASGHFLSDGVIFNRTERVANPRKKLDLFLPMRLYMPYEIWRTSDGARVLFSRDDFPLWRLKKGHEPERLLPWLTIDDKKSEQKFWYFDQDAPWRCSETKLEIESYLESNGIRTLPILAEALPILIQDSSTPDFLQAVNRLKEFYEAIKNLPKA